MNVKPQEPWKEVHTYKGGIRGTLDRLMSKFDKMVSGAMTYVVIAALAILVIILYLTGSSLSMKLITAAIGITGGLFGAYFINKSLDQEKNVQFFQGEQIILESKTPKTYAAISALGDQEVPLEAIKANIYLTNLGVLAERQGSGEATLFVPLDLMTDIAPYHQGLRIRAQDPRNQSIEVILYIEDRERWIREITDQIQKMSRIVR
jgi:hypothetical protein